MPGHPNRAFRPSVERVGGVIPYLIEDMVFICRPLNVTDHSSVKKNKKYPQKHDWTSPLIRNTITASKSGWTKELVSKCREVTKSRAETKQGTPAVGIDLATLKACIADANQVAVEKLGDDNNDFDDFDSSDDDFEESYF
mmetsp:Transcript_6128/g.8947  ORF Transcript_6128/g.8947 Transcript_6128/m.8947 type:complete len:140 (-) Transcript_6128:69-488(-)